MGDSLLFDFSGLPTDQTLRSLLSKSIVRIDPLDHAGLMDGLSPALTGSQVRSVVAYCSGAAAGVAASSALARSGYAPRLILIDPKEVDRQYVLKALREMVVGLGGVDDPRTDGALERCIEGPEEHAEAIFNEIVTPLALERLSSLDLGHGAAEELAQRYARWAGYLVWALTSHSPLEYNGPITVIRVRGDDDLVIAGRGERRIEYVTNSSGKYLSDQSVLAAVERELHIGSDE